MDFHDKNKKGQEPQNTVSNWEKPFERPAPAMTARPLPTASPLWITRFIL